MIDTIKSDLYYFRKKIKYVILALAMCYVMIAPQMVTAVLLGEDYRLSDLIIRYLMNAGFIVLLVLLILDSFYVGQLFQTRLINYLTIRAGRRRVVLAKYFLVCVLNVLFVIILYCAIMLALSLAAGGNRVMSALKELKEMKPMGIMILCLFILLIRFTVQLVSITVLTKNTGLAVLANYMYLILPSMPVELMGEENLGIFEFTRLFVMGQFFDLVNASDPMEMVGKIIVTSTISIILWMIVTLALFTRSDLK